MRKPVSNCTRTVVSKIGTASKYLVDITQAIKTTIMHTTKTKIYIM